ncbi:single-stranded-DNA-specific exonuclease RecJ [Thalassotalea sp. HSM 43]|uniref:single-stranded-DNA-specific exonuclease RecJ n=1 Tax=Thalassotalea sp. HSM 43 TaxID=2552945 RepID=UPI0010803D55|nr:single-stranded-DNA-specific exonuclease RecJ [Thalassotalea sp. HSM 43]QBY03597.1 single-stranded-DNA-specific exonuclease RecJ [Thalassotalea sp. HSM 43]
MDKQIRRRQQPSDIGFGEDLHPILRHIYASRGITKQEQLDQALTVMLAPKQLLGIEQAADILIAAIDNKQRIIIVGDFDADGATSTALMMQGLGLLGSANHDFIVPNRFEYGYGLTPEISDLAKQAGADVIVTVDNGISCYEGVERAKQHGCTVVITDHHLPGAKLPPADAIVNPNQKGCNFASKALAGVGVAFYLMLMMRQRMRETDYFAEHNLSEPNLAVLLDLVALGTVADVVSLDQNNRILVAQGLKRIRAGATRPGIEALIEVAGKNQQKLHASDFGFGLGPRLNAAGRLDDMSLGIKCLLADDMYQARVIAAQLDDLNKERRQIEQGMQIEAEQILQKLNFAQDNLPGALALYQDDWHQGVIGIVAGRIKEKYHRPTVVFAQGDEGTIKGSARSIPGLHIRDLLEYMDSQHPGLIAKFGGHAMAAGLTIGEQDFIRFQQLFSQYAAEKLSDDLLQGVVLSDGELPSSYLNLNFAELLKQAGPWGQNFPEPVFDNTFTVVQQRIVGDKHLKLVVQLGDLVIDAIAFNVDLSQWPNHQCQSLHMAYKLDINEFRGRQTVQLMVEHLQAL